jgi:hypothetical protein
MTEEDIEAKLTELEARVSDLERHVTSPGQQRGEGDQQLMARVKAFLDKYVSQDPLPPPLPPANAMTPATNPWPNAQPQQTNDAQRSL